MFWELSGLLVVTLLLSLIATANIWAMRSEMHDVAIPADQRAASVRQAGLTVLLSLWIVAMPILTWCGIGLGWLLRVEDNFLFWKILLILPGAHVACIIITAFLFPTFLLLAERPGLYAAGACVVSLLFSGLVGWWSLHFWQIAPIICLHIVYWGMPHIADKSCGWLLGVKEGSL